MGLECIAEQNGTWLRFGWICDRCGEEITDITDGVADYNAWDPLPEDPELRTKELRVRQGHDRLVTFHKACAPTGSAGRYWRNLGDVVWDLMLPQDRKTSKSVLAERAHRRRDGGF